MVLFHGSREIVRFPEVRRAVFNKDFYFGFYCTVYKEQAEPVSYTHLNTTKNVAYPLSDG